MDIIKRNRLKISSLLVVIIFSLLIVLSLEFLLSIDDISMIFQENFYESYKFLDMFNNDLNNLDLLVNEYISEDEILSKDLFEKNNLAVDYLYRKKNTYINENSREWDLLEDEFKKLDEESPELIDKFKAEVRESLMSDMKELESKLKRNKGLIYYASNPDRTFTNLSNMEVSKKDFKNYPFYLILDKGSLEFQPKLGAIENMVKVNNLENHKFTSLLLSYDKEYLGELEKDWYKNKNEFRKYFNLILALAIGLLISFLRLIFSINPEDEKTKESFTSKLPISILLMAAFFTIISWFIIIVLLINNDILQENILYEKTYINKIIEIILFIVTFLLASLGLSFVKAIIIQIKQRKLIENSLSYRFLSKLKGKFIKIEIDTNLRRKFLAFLLIYSFILRKFNLIIIIPFLLVLFYGFRKINDFEEILEGVEKIKKGDLDYKIKTSEKGELAQLGENINTIGEGLKKSVEKELKSERYRSELITNLSHDIRTPLTSVITYIDLLKEEDNLEKRMEYIEVLNVKSQRLKKLIDDLFEATKLNSGDIPVNLEKIDLLALINQGLGEMNKEIQASGLDFIVNSNSQGNLVLADGNLLWRAIENTLSNILKYSQERSRVYIDILDREEYLSLEFKNISRDKLNISEEDLMKRFKRADSSRTGEGSGLGLSIAESLIVLQEGSFEIKIDGDLFKTIIRLIKYK